ncbi:hypothetical protein [Mesorhizobium sp. WSM3626]|uniref:hypothetical protein n=1 Tax=Mesorhizobium sp. WSM3626 TaxID=1040987 RepID=UPI0004B63891|nr:hypothetical protein [Mesorhizobium sp. WSM3626]
MEITKSFGKWFLVNWERVLFVVVGLAFLSTCFYLIFAEKVTEAAVVFGLGFLSFIYANVARFKRFKGLGFEAELWEDKQQEAADLIERLKNVVSIYTREIIMSKVTEGRWGGKPKWQSHWALYDELAEQHDQLGQKIDFSALKKSMDDYFLFDLCELPTDRLTKILWDERAKVRQMISKEFGSPISDADGHGKRIRQLNETEFRIVDAFEISKNGNLAQDTLDAFNSACSKFKEYFRLEPRADQPTLDRMSKLAELYRHRPVHVTAELIAWSNEQKGENA